MIEIQTILILISSIPVVRLLKGKEIALIQFNTFEILLVLGSLTCNASYCTCQREKWQL